MRKGNNVATKNDITGDALISKVNNKQYEDNFDRIFGKKPVVTPTTPEDVLDDWDENRIDVISQNGNTGEHYNE